MGKLLAIIVCITIGLGAAIVALSSQGPPLVDMNEAYDERTGNAVFNHAPWQAVLDRYVDKQGKVAYGQLAKDTDHLDQYIDAMRHAPFDQMGRDEKLALLINAYNAFTLRLVLDYWDGGKLQSIKDIGQSQRWNDKRWHLAGRTWSLNEIEHDQIRIHFREPRIHFALVCAAEGCPPLRGEAYSGKLLATQLEDQARLIHGNKRWFRFDPAKNQVHMTRLYKWYAGDFEQVTGSVLQYASRYVPQLKTALQAEDKPAIRWLDYNWKLNGS